MNRLLAFELFILVMPQFVELVDMIVNSSETEDEYVFIDAARLVYEGMRDIRRAVQMRKVSLDYQYFHLLTVCDNSLLLIV